MELEGDGVFEFKEKYLKMIGYVAIGDRNEFFRRNSFEEIIRIEKCSKIYVCRKWGRFK